MADICRIGSLCDLFDDVAAVEIGPRQIDRHRHNRDAVFFLVVHFFQHQLGDIQIQFVDQPRSFKDWNEISGRQEAEGRIDPSCQRFLFAHLPAVGPHNRLIVDLNPVLRKRPVEILDDILAPLRIHIEFRREVPEGGGIRIVQFSPGKLCPVTGNAGRRIGAIHAVDSGMDRQALSLIDLPAFLKDLIQRLVQAFFFGDCRKVITADPAAVLIAEMADENRRKLLQKPVSFRKPMPAVIELHTGKIEEKHGGFRPAVHDLIPLPVGELKEIGHHRQSGQKIVVIPLADAFPQLFLKLIPVFLFFIFQNKAPKHTASEKTTRRIHRKQRKAVLDNHEYRHDQAEQTDRVMSCLLDTPLSRGSGIHIHHRHQKHRNLRCQCHISR